MGTGQHLREERAECWHERASASESWAQANTSARNERSAGMSAQQDRSRPAGTTAGKVAGAGRQAADSAEDASQEAMDSKPFRILLTVGLVSYGVVHILIGWIALQIAWFGGGGEEASQKGALAAIAGGPFGATLLWITVIGLF